MDRQFVGRIAGLLIAVFLSGEAGAWPATLEVTISVGGSAPAEHVPVVLTATPAKDSQKPSRLELIAPISSALQLPLQQPWTLEMEASGYWAPPKTVVLTSESQGVGLELWPTGMLTARIEVEEGERPPEELTLRFRHPPQGVSGPTSTADLTSASSQPPEGEVVCPIAESRIRCPIPGGRWDLRARAKGFVSHYFWGMEVGEGSVGHLGTLKLKPGSSVVGWVTTLDGRDDLAGFRVTLRPRQARPGAMDADERISRLVVETKTDERGFFHLVDLDPGNYELTATGKGYAPARFFPLIVLPRSESAVQEPLLLQPPLELSVSVDPPLSPWGEPWILRITESGRTPGHSDVIYRSALEDSGFVNVTGLASGHYVLWIEDEASHDRWLRQEVDLQVSGEHIPLTVPVVEVEGRVLLGDRGIPAVLFFGGAFGATRIRLEADREGRFLGYLSREGDWPVEIQNEDPPIRRHLKAVEVRRASGQSIARVDIELGAGVIHGRVINPDGDTVAGAQVELNGLLQGEMPVDRSTDEEGVFTFEGLDTGTFLLEAGRGDLVSDTIRIALEEPEDRESVDLVLHPRVLLTGTVLGPRGGVPGAGVTALSSRHPQTVMAVTDARGMFSIALPRQLAQTGEVDLIVQPPGQALTTSRTSIPRAEPLQISVDRGRGGTLVLAIEEAPPEKGWVPDQVAIVFRNGVAIGTHFFVEWNEMNGVVQDAGEFMVIPDVDQGEYRLCRIPLQRLGQAMGSRSSMATVADRCDGGYLTPGGRLELHLRLRD